MDFSSILHAAQKNDRNSSAGGNYYKSKFEPPKKECKSKTLSSNIQKFLQKKEEEERSKAEESKRKRNELTAMRDTKANNKIKKMLKVIKSANKSVLADAVDNINTAVTMHGPEQPDEDDYGYVSQEASAFYSKMMEKYKNIPEEDNKFSKSKKTVSHDLSGTKDRVRAAMVRQQEEDAMPHRRKRRSKTSPDGHPPSPNVYSDESSRPTEKKDEKQKSKRPAPPPLDFNQLLKIAEKKQFEPVVVETKKPEKVEEPERLMTKRQRREYEEQKALRESRLKREQERAREVHSGGKVVKKSKPETVNQQMKPVNPMSIRIPKLSDKLATTNSSSPKNTPRSSSLDKGKSAKSEARIGLAKRDDGRGNNEIRVDFRNKRPSESLTNNIKVNGTLSAKIPKSESNVLPKGFPGTSLNKSRNIQDRKDMSENHKRPEKHEIGVSKIQLGDKSNLNRTKTQTIPSRADFVAKKSQSELPNKVPLDLKSRNVSGNVKSDRPPVSQFGTKRPVSENNTSAKSLLSKKPTEIDKGGKPGNHPSSNRPELKGTRPGNLQSSKSSTSIDTKGGRQFPPSDVRGVRQFPPADVKKPRQLLPTDAKGSRQFPPQDIKSRRDKPPPGKRRILDDDDSEYDSELDDFIDDGPEDGGNDYSKYIKEIFGYDKSRYRDAEDDDRHMESNFSQVMREEYISKKIGIMEDLEDMKLEALEKKKKMQKRRRIDD